MAARGEVKGGMEMRALVTKIFGGGKFNTAKNKG
jgi:hypothetical protein